MSHGFIARGGLWVLAQGVLMLIVAALGICFRGQMWPGAGVMGVVLMGIGAVIALAGALGLRKNLTSFPKPLEESELVERGIYRWVRHPLYLSLIVTALGWAWFWQSGPALAATVPLALFFDLKARREERWLRAAFPGYTAYARRVSRFVPWIY